MSLKRLLNDTDSYAVADERRAQLLRSRMDSEYPAHIMNDIAHEESDSMFFDDHSMSTDLTFSNLYYNIDPGTEHVDLIGNFSAAPGNNYYYSQSSEATSEQPPDSSLPLSQPLSSTVDVDLEDDCEETTHSSPSESDHDMQGEQICYGMLYHEKIKIIGNGQDLLKKVRRLRQESQQTSRNYTFSIRKSSEQQLFLRFPDSSNLGYLSEKLANALRHLFDGSSTKFEAEAIASLSLLEETVLRSGKASDAAMRVNINVYGLKSDRDDVGKGLSSAGLFLQDPDHYRSGIEYSNPHVMEFSDIEESEDELQMDENGLSTEAEPAQDEEFTQVVAEVFNSLKRGHGLQRVQGNDKVKIPLFPHQEEALDFMMQRETGNISTDFRLWQPRVIEDEQYYFHTITNHREREQPDESGGGILADEMGMGKSLTTLALVMRTTKESRQWMEDQLGLEPEISTGKASRATLIIVPSPVIINSWVREIDTHLDGKIAVMRYHGRKRKELIKNIDNYDMVITTYSTLAVEHGRAKKGKERSSLHDIAWYRVILDEAHMIRRVPTTFHRAAIGLAARFRWCLSGTPIQNSLSDLGALLAFTQIKPFDSLPTFRSFVAIPFEDSRRKQQGIERLALLLEALCLRRTIDTVDIPSQIETEHFVDFTDEERSHYEEVKRAMYKTLTQQANERRSRKSLSGMFQIYLQLRILCNHGTYQQRLLWAKRDLLDAEEDAVCSLTRDSFNRCSGCREPLPVLWREKGPRYIEQCKHVLCKECVEDSVKQSDPNKLEHCPLCEPVGGPAIPLHPEHRPPSLRAASMVDYFQATGRSSKIDALVSDVLLQLASTKSIIFSCWTRTLDLIGRHLESAEIAFVRIDGTTSQKRRQDILDEFDGTTKVRVLVMTTGTGAFGLNLQSVNRVFIVEPQWNPSVERQAVARAIRLGQTQQVLVVRYYVKDSIEQDMCKQQTKKLHISKMEFRKELTLRPHNSIPGHEAGQMQLNEAMN